MAPVQPASGGKAGKATKERRRSGSMLGRLIGGLFYWGTVCALWGVIAAIGVLGYTFATLPKLDDWKVPARPPNIEIVDAAGALIAWAVWRIRQERPLEEGNPKGRSS